MVSWNGRGICVACTRARREAANIILELAKGFDVLCFQEVHGLPTEILRQFQIWLPNWQFCVSGFLDTAGFPNPGAGGVVIAVKPGVARGEVSHTVLIHGRCHFASFLGPKRQQFNIMNLHNFDLTIDDVNNVGTCMDNFGLAARNLPVSSFSMLVGDVNFDGSGVLDSSGQEDKSHHRFCQDPCPFTRAVGFGRNTWTSGLKFPNHSRHISPQRAKLVQKSIGDGWPVQPTKFSK